MRSLPLGVSLAFALLGGSGAVLGGPAIGLKTAVNNCQNDQLELATRIEACNEVIHSNLLSRRLLADFYFIRGNVYLKNGKADEALLDYDKALELKPDFPQAQNNRSLAVSERAEPNPVSPAPSQPAASGEKTGAPE